MMSQKKIISKNIEKYIACVEANKDQRFKNPNELTEEEKREIFKDVIELIFRHHHK